jgi:hypothetical protein
MRQPGCEPSNWDSILSDPLAIPSDVIACDHTRAVHIYSESLLSSSCKTIGYECSDYDSFNKVTATTCFKFTVINVINLIIRKGQVHDLWLGQHALRTVWLTSHKFPDTQPNKRQTLLQHWRKFPILQ